MGFHITFEGRNRVYETRMSRQQAASWLRSRGFDGMVSEPSGEKTPLESLDEDRLAQGIAGVTIGMVSDLATRHESLIIRNVETNGSRVWTSVRAESIDAVTVVVSDVSEDQEDGLAPLPFIEPDKEWIADKLRLLDEDQSE